MHLTKTLITQICDLIDLDKESFQIELRPGFNPECDLINRIIYISVKDGWRSIYQFSHEALHLSFFDHNNHFISDDFLWIEEIVCEAFSIYCLEQFVVNEKKDWKYLLYEECYILISKIQAPKTIQSLQHLNNELIGDKDESTLQYIHEYVLHLYMMMISDIEHLQSFLDFVKYTSGGRIMQETRHVLARPLIDLQEKFDAKQEDISSNL